MALKHIHGIEAEVHKSQGVTLHLFRPQNLNLRRIVNRKRRTLKSTSPKKRMKLIVTSEPQMKGTRFVTWNTGSDDIFSIVIERVTNQRSVEFEIMGSQVWYCFPKMFKCGLKLLCYVQR